jgi:cupin 2 domain-containing protein
MPVPHATNLFALPPLPTVSEIVDTLLAGECLRIERIVSTGQTTPAGKWYDQEGDEWVVLLRGDAELAFDDGTRCRLAAGDYLYIPAHQRHRVEYTSTSPPCIWLAVHTPGAMATADPA